jgi:hypothetical protein
MLLAEILLKNFKINPKDDLLEKTFVTKEFKPMLNSLEERKMRK